MPCLPEALRAGEQPLAAGETARTIELGERTVSYVLRRARRRTIGLTIDHRGLRVGAPPRASLREVESLILQHGEWVGRKLDEWRTRRPGATANRRWRAAAAARPAADDPPRPRRQSLRLEPAGFRADADPLPAFAGRSTSPGCSKRRLRESARSLFIERLAEHAPLRSALICRVSRCRRPHPLG
jgi:hypothetical protein